MTPKEKLKEALILETRKAFFLNELAAYTALRNLQVQAEEAALKFEEQIVKQLGLIHPDKMDPVAQRVYHQATTKLMTVFRSAIVDTVQEMQGLPKEADLAQEGEEAAPAHAQVTF